MKIKRSIIAIAAAAAIAVVTKIVLNFKRERDNNWIGMYKSQDNRPGSDNSDSDDASDKHPLPGQPGYGPHVPGYINPSGCWPNLDTVGVVDKTEKSES